MFEISSLEKSHSKAGLYQSLAQQMSALLGSERDAMANAANAAALIYHVLPDLNWAGFYFLKENSQLVLGPFQGKPACTRIDLNRGVCGTAAAKKTSLVVPDVHAFPGHIACDSDSRSELVIPLLKNDRIWGVLDLDSPLPARFDNEDRSGCENLVSLYLDCSDIG